MTETNELTLLGEKRSDIFKIDPRSLIVDETKNVRVDYGDIEALAISIAENGVKNPLRGYRLSENSPIHLTDGFRRNRAIQLAISSGLIDIEKDNFRVPVILEKKGYRDEDRIFDMFITQDNKQLLPIEVAEVFYRLHYKFEFTAAEIAKRSGKSVPYVNDMLKLATAPSEVRNEVKEGNIQAPAAIHIIKEIDKEEKLSDSPDNVISNTKKVEQVKKAVEQAKKAGKKTATKKTLGITKKSVAPASNTDLIYELRNILHDQKKCMLAERVLSSLLTYLGNRKITIVEQIEKFESICEKEAVS